MGIVARIYDSPLGNCSNNGVSAKYTEVCVVNVEGPFEPTEDTPAVRLIKRSAGNVVCVPIGQKANGPCLAARSYTHQIAGSIKQ
jgi:hypothetical protein